MLQEIEWANNCYWLQIPPLVLWVHLLNDKPLNVPDAAKSFVQRLIERMEPVQIKLVMI